MKRRILALLVVVLAPMALADELVRLIQQDLDTLGYDVGAVDGQMSTRTAIAISRFQAERDLEVTGEATPQLAGIIQAEIAVMNDPQAAPALPEAASGSVGMADTAAEPYDDASAFDDQDDQDVAGDGWLAEQRCLENKIAAAEAAEQKKRGFGSLMQAASRLAGRYGSDETYRDVVQAEQDYQDATATAEDLESAARDLGITEDEIEQCRQQAG